MMDGLKHSDGIYLMGSTNKHELIDDAFLRPGRFSQQIEVGLLTNDYYFDFFKKQVEGIPSEISDQDWRNLVLRLQDHISGAELKGFVDRIKHCAARRCISEDTVISLNLNDLEPALQSSRHLLKAVNPSPEYFDDDGWDEEKDDDGWVIP